jgi:hypothetical protein
VIFNIAKWVIFGYQYLDIIMVNYNQLLMGKISLILHPFCNINGYKREHLLGNDASEARGRPTD